MTFLPIVERELRVAARRRGTYWSRFAAAIIGSGLAAWVLAMMSDEPAADAGGALFATLAVLVFVYAAAVGIGVTFDCLSEEKREGTLGLLFLTDLKGYDVVLGKLAATSLNAFYGMLAVVPVLAIPFLLGAVTNAEFWRVVLVAVNLLFFLMSAGLLASSACRNGAKAAGLAVVLATISLGAAPLYAAWRASHNVNFDFSLVLLPSPAFGCFLAFDDLYKHIGGSFFWLNALITHLYFWIFLLLACWIAPRSWQDDVVNQNAGFWGRTRRMLLDGTPARRAATRRCLLNINPFLWRAAPNSSASLPVLLVMAGATLLWMGWCHIFQMELFNPDSVTTLIFGLNLILKIGVAGAASRPLYADRRSGALELLLTTPLGAREIVRGQWLALLRKFAAPTATLFAANFLCLLREWRSSNDRKELLWMHVMLNGFLLMDMYALSWTAMWFGLRARKSRLPAVAALLAILAPPPVALALVAGYYAVFLPQSDIGDHGPYIILSIAGVATDGWFAWYAKRKLRKHFRTTVAEGLAPARVIK